MINRPIEWGGAHANFLHFYGHKLFIPLLPIKKNILGVPLMVNIVPRPQLERHAGGAQRGGGPTSRPGTLVIPQLDSSSCCTTSRIFEKKNCGFSKTLSSAQNQNFVKKKSFLI